MEKRPFQATREDRRRIRIRTQLLFRCYTGRAIALLIACALIVWFLFLQLASADAQNNFLLTARPDPPTIWWAVIK